MSTSSSWSTNHNKRLSSETDSSHRVLDSDTTQHLKIQERQHFFEDVYQHDMEFLLSSAHLNVDCRKRERAPMGSISSMEVNVDLLEQMDLMDISDQEALDVFLNSGADDGLLQSPLPEFDNEDEEEEENDSNKVVYKEHMPIRQHIDSSRGFKSRTSSTSSGSSDTSRGRTDTPVVQSDDEEVHDDTLVLTSVPTTNDEETEEED
ncbi:hypothetical protein UPYG_G00013840 [Umbra pygmaea]|uniref:Dysbindin n=1 Tax=Umbra pygmaea TaxID=75934 RepID=A0ABD0Y6J3_UMBPY